MKDSDGLSTKQSKLIALLLTERTIEAACQKAKVAPTTYWRWMKEESFLAAYRRVRRGILENAVAKLQGIVFQAVDVLERSMTCENPSVELRAASIVLEQSIKGLEILDVEARLEVLESLLSYKKTHGESV